MTRRRLLAALLAAAGVATTGIGATTPAQAATCYYGIWMDGRGMLGIDRSATAAKRKTACTRARRRCNRTLDRLRKSGRELPRHTPRSIRCKRYGA